MFFNLFHQQHNFQTKSVGVIGNVRPGLAGDMFILFLFFCSDRKYMTFSVFTCKRCSLTISVSSDAEFKEILPNG